MLYELCLCCGKAVPLKDLNEKQLCKACKEKDKEEKNDKIFIL